MQLLSQLKVQRKFLRKIFKYGYPKGRPNLRIVRGSFNTPFRKGWIMDHTLKISVSKKPATGGIVSCRHISVRERFLRFLLGDKQQLTVIVPGDSVRELAISEVKEGGAVHEQSEITA